MFILNGKTLSPDRAFTIQDGTQYPSNWLRFSTPEQREAIGIIEQEDPPIWDQRYYLGYGEDGNLIPRDLDELKKLHISQTKQIANIDLSSTDWYVTRKVERNIDIPPDISSYRAAVIQVSEERETLISSVTTVEELKDLVLPNWPNQNTSNLQIPN